VVKSGSPTAGINRTDDITLSEHAAELAGLIIELVEWRQGGLWLCGILICFIVCVATLRSCVVMAALLYIVRKPRRAMRSQMLL
jgi:hypothetical protein